WASTAPAARTAAPTAAPTAATPHPRPSISPPSFPGEPTCCQRANFVLGQAEQLFCCKRTDNHILDFYDLDDCSILETDSAIWHVRRGADPCSLLLTLRPDRK